MLGAPHCGVAGAGEAGVEELDLVVVAGEGEVAWAGEAEGEGLDLVVVAGEVEAAWVGEAGVDEGAGEAVVGELTGEAGGNEVVAGHEEPIMGQQAGLL